MSEPARQHLLRVRDYDLAATLASGQAFRWRECTTERRSPNRPDEVGSTIRFGDRRSSAWEGVIAGKWVRLTQVPEGIVAETARPVADWTWLAHYLQTEIDLASVLRSFPDDEPMRLAIAACHGLRLLRQEPWECLASFILSSTIC